MMASCTKAHCQTQRGRVGGNLEMKYHAAETHQLTRNSRQLVQCLTERREFLVILNPWGHGPMATRSLESDPETEVSSFRTPGGMAQWLPGHWKVTLRQKGYF